jgi:hypothetical protein
MGDKSQHCALGNFRHVRNDPATDKLLARKYYLSDFSPSQKGLEFMKRVAEDIEGIADIVETYEAGTSFALVFDSGVHIDVTASLWVTAFRRAVNKTPKDQRPLLIGGTSFYFQNPDAELVALYGSERYTHERD